MFETNVVFNNDCARWNNKQYCLAACTFEPRREQNDVMMSAIGRKRNAFSVNWSCRRSGRGRSETQAQHPDALDAISRECYSREMQSPQHNAPLPLTDMFDSSNDPPLPFMTEDSNTYYVY
ncbi:hypothetical protein R3P38DRAFT_2781479 [Favolaschia claudopus]|uniref:Uncharacterized protein n=1 Tax=Favolaschia claudopus TaxID=2862362 RepID=A0AAW0B7V9_9AGAR